jgi:hypothetical protein
MTWSIDFYSVASEKQYDGTEAIPIGELPTQMTKELSSPVNITWTYRGPTAAGYYSSFNIEFRVPVSGQDNEVGVLNFYNGDATTTYNEIKSNAQYWYYNITIEGYTIHPKQVLLSSLSFNYTGKDNTNTYTYNGAGPELADVSGQIASGVVVTGDTVGLNITDVSVSSFNVGVQNITFTVSLTGASKDNYSIYDSGSYLGNTNVDVEKQGAFHVTAYTMTEQDFDFQFCNKNVTYDNYKTQTAAQFIGFFPSVDAKYDFIDWSSAAISLPDTNTIIVSNFVSTSSNIIVDENFILDYSLESFTPTQLTATINVDDKEYDGGVTAEITNVELTGIYEGDTVNYDYGFTAEFETAEVGPKYVSFSGDASLTGLQSQFYSVASPESVLREITEKEVEIYSIYIQTKEYDGNTTATITDVTLNGVVEGETVSVDYSSATATFNNASVGENKQVTIGGSFTLQGADSNNYTLSNQLPYTTGTITSVAVITNENIDVDTLVHESIVSYFDNDINAAVSVKVIKLNATTNYTVNENVTLVSPSTTKTYLFYEADPTLYTVNSGVPIYSMVFKEFDAQNNLIVDTETTLIINIPNNNFQTITFYKNNSNTVAATGTRATVNDPFTVTVVKEMLGNAVGNQQFNNASIGSDPHIYTLSGKKYDLLKPSSRKWYNILSYGDVRIMGHFTGFNKGIFFDALKINKNNSEINVDFKKSNITQNSNNFSINKSFKTIKYENNTSDKSKGSMINLSKYFDNIIVPDESYPLNVNVDFKTRYVHFNFPKSTPTSVNGLLS